MIIFADSPTTLIIDMPTALAAAGALSGGIMGAAKILISWLAHVLDDIKVNRAEKQEHDKLLFQIQKETVETMSEIKNDFVVAISGVQSALQSLSSRLESLETPQLALPPKIITGESKP